MSETFAFTIQSVQEKEIIARVRTETAGRLNDFFDTPSFALMALCDQGGYDARPRRTCREIQEDFYVEPQFYRDHVDKFISSVELLERRNIFPDPTPDDALERVYACVNENTYYDDTPSEEKLEKENAMCEVLHNFTLRIIVTDPDHAADLKPGMVFGTSAYDV